MSDRLKDCRVFIVEDNFYLAETLEQFMQAAGAEVVGTRATVREAMQFVARSRQHIDVALLVINLHGEMSYPVAEALTASQIPFVFTTGYDRASIDARFRDRPVCSTPFVPAVLWEMVDSVRGH